MPFGGGHEKTKAVTEGKEGKLGRGGDGGGGRSTDRLGGEEEKQKGWWKDERNTVRRGTGSGMSAGWREAEVVVGGRGVRGAGRDGQHLSWHSIFCTTSPGVDPGVVYTQKHTLFNCCRALSQKRGCRYLHK